MQWATEDGDGTKGLLELAWRRGHFHTLPLLVSMGAVWQAHHRMKAIDAVRLQQIIDVHDGVVRKPTGSRHAALHLRKQSNDTLYTQ
jgi:hypothetical protein